MTKPLGSSGSCIVNETNCERDETTHGKGSDDMISTLLVTTACLAGLPSWEFDDPGVLRQWVPNSHLQNVSVADGLLHASAHDWDPFLTCRGLDFKTTPWQYVVLRIKADESGVAELYWSGETTGQYGGLDPKKTTRFQVRGGDQWQEIVLYPFWQGEGTIRQLRLDVYQGVTFAVDYIRIEEWSGKAGTAPVDRTEWLSSEELSGWKRHDSGTQYFSPPLQVDVGARPWVALQITSPTQGAGSVSWATRTSNGKRSCEFQIEPAKEPRWYNVPMHSNTGWTGTIVLLGVQVPQGAVLNAVKLTAQPAGPAHLKTDSFGFTEGVNRVGQTAQLRWYVQNVGGAVSRPVDVRLQLPAELTLVGQPAVQSIESIAVGQHAVVTWNVSGRAAGHLEVELKAEPYLSLRKKLRIDPAVPPQTANYVPPPRPVATKIEVCAYYFPGFKPDKKWTPIRDTAPWRKPLLGWYDEGNPECVDWQIKWARENGISVFLVDWYWVAGKQQLTHWFEAYRKARYRDQLKVAIMWANHNRPNTHTMKDWDQVTRHWLDHYFNLPAYYRVNGKPLVMIWDPRRLREDLVQEELRRHTDGTPDSSALVRKALEHSRKLARDAGYDGITFAAIQHAPSKSQCETLSVESYDVVTTYHEWGKARDLGPSALRMRFDDVVATAAEAWQHWDSISGALDYYPVVDTGWDSRPWHGARARVMTGRTPEKFERLLRAAADYVTKTGGSRVVLGPVNEWGEGSYIEPCAEFGFEMLEKIRQVFGQGDSAHWPINIGPADVGLGPYE